MASVTRPTCCSLLNTGYELFPSFSAFTRENADEDTFTQELRLVSTSEGPFNWIVGAFYNDYQADTLSQEFTPGFDQFAVDELGGVQLRPDSLEYYESIDRTEKETALFGELGYRDYRRLAGDGGGALVQV